MRGFIFKILLTGLLFFTGLGLGPLGHGSLAWAQQNVAFNQSDFDVSFSIDWTRGEIYSQTSFSLAQAGIRLPAGRFLGEEILMEAYPGLLRPHILGIRVNSNSTIGDLLERGELSIRNLDSLSLGADKAPANLSRDLTRMIRNYTLSLDKISAFLNPARRASEPERPLIPVQTADYTGIIIIANNELPLHGRISQALAEPCLFPRIWDTNMNLLYDRTMFEPGSRYTGGEIDFLMNRYAPIYDILRPSPSGLEGELLELLGPRPLRIFARGVYGVSPTDLIIDRQDALRILSSENNRRLLREGRVLLVLDEGLLR